MTLKEQYTIKNKRRIKQFIFLYSILVLFLTLYSSSFAKYEKETEGYLKAEVANWNMMLNDKKLTSKNTEGFTINVISTTNKNENSEDKIIPGQNGYFDIVIDPTDTEVSFEYEITLDLKKFPESLKITSYSINTGDPIALQYEDTIILSDNVLLNERNIFTSDDKQTIRFFWTWNDEFNNIGSYEMGVNVELQQYL